MSYRIHNSYIVFAEIAAKELQLEPDRRERPNQPEFEGILEKSIQEGLRNILGQSGLQLVLSLYPLKHISTDPAMFHKILRDVFKESGAALIEREVAERLLQNVGNGTEVRGASRRSWLTPAGSGGKESDRVSKKEKEVLRQFLALEPLTQGRTRMVRSEVTQIDLTADRFAYAFKKGS